MLSEKHILLTSAEVISEICKPIFETYGITYFEYLRVYEDGSRACLTTNPTKIKHTLSIDYAESTDYDSRITKIKSGLVLWNDGKNFLPPKSRCLIDKKISDDYNHYNISHGIAIVESGNGYFDSFNFATSVHNSAIVDFYFANFDLLKLFILYFKDKAQPLIKKSHKQKISMPRLLVSEQQLASDKICDQSASRRSAFLKQIKPRRYFLGNRYNYCYLTEKQASCLTLLALHKTAKQIAKILGISPRTVEYHINTIKQKLNCNHISELVQIYWQSPLAELQEEILTWTLGKKFLKVPSG